MRGKLDELSDEELMALYQMGSEAAFSCLYSRYEARVYGFLRKRVLDPHAANDLFQAAFLKLHRSKNQFNTSFLFAPWLFAVVRTTFLDWQKEQKGKINLAEFKDDLAIQAESQRVPIARADLSGLPDPQRSAVEMRYFDDLSFEEIAAHMETTSGNARQLVSRGLKSLKALFTKRGGR